MNKLDNFIIKTKAKTTIIKTLGSISKPLSLTSGEKPIMPAEPIGIVTFSSAML